MKSSIPHSRVGRAWIHRLGLALAGVFYLVSVVYVYFFTANTSLIDPDMTVLTIAHWELQDGCREGFALNIDRFEKLKAAQGVKVKVVQSPVPFRGYKQWMMTQLIGGNPADLVELSGPSNVLYQFFVPLSSYVGKPNPFNKGTPLEGMIWRDSFIDGMSSILDPTYSEYFGVGTFFHTYRLHVNVDLVEKATGSRKMPKDISEWIEICRLVKDYGRKTGKPITPIGMRGFDRITLQNLFRRYFSQTNGQLNDLLSRFCDGQVQPVDILLELNKQAIDPQRLTAVVAILKDLGQYFSEGFTAVDVEQVQYLFSSGLVAFFPEGSWNSYSLIRHAPFEVAVIPVPVIGKKSSYSRYYTGPVTESAVRVGGRFGIPKACKNFDLALEFLQFMTSYENNIAAMDLRKWPPAVKKAEFKGILKDFLPRQDGNLSVRQPFSMPGETGSTRKLMETLERIILEQVENPRQYFLNAFFSRAWQKRLVFELNETLVGYRRIELEREEQRSQLSIGLLGLKDLSPNEQTQLRFRQRLSAESRAEDPRKRYLTQLRLGAIANLKQVTKKSQSKQQGY